MKVRQLMTGGLLCLFAMTAGAIQAQDRSQGEGNRNQDQNNRGQDQRDQNRNDQHSQDQARFDDHDRQVSRDWYNQHQNHRPRGLRDRDRLDPQYESHLRNGYVLDRNMRSRIYAVPSDYYRQLPPPPRGYRYVFVGGHAVLIDRDYRVHDVIHFELNF